MLYHVRYQIKINNACNKLEIKEFVDDRLKIWQIFSDEPYFLMTC